MFKWQERTWTCGPAAFRIAIANLKIKKSEKYLVKLLKTSKWVGTNNKNFIKAVRHYNLSYVYKDMGSLDEIKNLLDENYQVIVSYYSKINGGHFAAVKKVTKESICLLDPSLGPNLKYKRNYFMKIWKSQWNKDNRWFIAFKKKK